MSMEWRRPVTEVIGERLWLTVVVSVAALILTWVLALPIGIYSAVRQYSIGDYVATFIGFIGLAVPNFLLALVLLYFGLRVLQRAHRRAVLAGAAGRAVEHGQGLGSDEAPADPGGDPGAGRHRPADPHHAREPARRAAQAVRGDRALQGPDRGQRHPEVPGARGPQSVREHHRLHAALHRLRQHHRVAGARPADGGTAAAQGSHRAGHVPGRHHRAAARGHDRDRHAGLRTSSWCWIDPRIRLEET